MAVRLCIVLSMPATRYRVKFIVGPCLVKQLAQKFREAGFFLTEGTETLYLPAQGQDFTEAVGSILDTLKRKHGTTFGLVGKQF